MARSGEEGTVETRRSSGCRGIRRVVELWWSVISKRERENRELRLQAQGRRRTVKWVRDLNPN